MILITGANGLLGSFVCNELLKSDKEVVAFVREGADLSLLNTDHKGLHLFEGDILDLLSLQKVFEEYSPERVVHAAAVVSFQPKEYDKMYYVNVEGTKNVVNTCLEYDITKFIYISSVAALGRSSNGLVNEKTAWNPGIYNSKYGISKKDAEVEVWRAQVEGLNSIILNPSLVLAPADGNRSSSKLFTLIKGESKFYPLGDINYVDIRDLVQIINSLLYSDISNERFIISAGSISYKDFFTKAAEYQGLKAPKFPVKKITGIMALLGDKIRSSLGNRKPMLSAESLRVSRSKVRFDNTKIKDKLNFQFRPLEESLKWVWEGFKF